MNAQQTRETGTLVTGCYPRRYTTLLIRRFHSWRGSIGPRIRRRVRRALAFHCSCACMYIYIYIYVCAFTLIEPSANFTTADDAAASDAGTPITVPNKSHFISQDFCVSILPYFFEKAWIIKNQRDLASFFWNEYSRWIRLNLNRSQLQFRAMVIISR